MQVLSILGFYMLMSWIKKIVILPSYRLLINKLFSLWKLKIDYLYPFLHALVSLTFLFYNFSYVKYIQGVPEELSFILRVNRRGKKVLKIYRSDAYFGCDRKYKLMKNFYRSTSCVQRYVNRNVTACWVRASYILFCVACALSTP